MRSYKNTELISIFDKASSDYCNGIGLRKIKLFLNKKIKEGDTFADVLRQILECETLNINAKKYNNTYSFSYRESYYRKKSEAVNSLIKSLLERNPDNVEMFMEKSDVSDTSDIIYFEHPSFSQISFHCDIESASKRMLPVSKNRWDKRVNSTLGKLEKAIVTTYSEELKEKYGEIITEFIEKLRLKEEKKRKEKEYKEKIRKETNTVMEQLEPDLANIFSLENTDTIKQSVWTNVFGKLMYKQRDKLASLFVKRYCTDATDENADSVIRNKIIEEEKDYLLNFLKPKLLKRIKKQIHKTTVKQ